MQVCDKFVSAETPLFTMFFVFFKLPVTKSQSFCSKNERGKGDGKDGMPWQNMLCQ
jgi:hypothetical protein